jgi:hypothetical protein
MKLNADGYKPDLLIHRPSEMAGNHAVMELKSARATRNGIAKDLGTLAIFRQAVGYARALYLVYGEEIDDRLVERICKTAESMRICLSIELWLHHAPGHPAYHAVTLHPTAAS